MKKSIIILCSLIFINGSLFAQKKIKENKNKVDYNNFLDLSFKLKEYREARLINEETFLKFSTEKNTIILDTRSKSAFDDIHIAGAIHLNFSDFTAEKLAKIIPDKNTRILIYCNNNFESDLLALANKSPSLALNIPTFINLYGYGFENIYELEGYIKEENSLLPLILKY